MRLNDKLNALKEEFAGTAPPESLKVIGAAIGNLVESGIMDKVTGEGETMPTFQLADTEGRMVSSAGLLARGPLVVHFYRGVW
jgi:hypothetical protein